MISPLTKDNSAIRPPMTGQEIRKLVKSLYGMHVANTKRLGGFDDSNWYIMVDSTETSQPAPSEDNEFMFKVVSGRDSTQSALALFGAQIHIMQYLHRKKIVNVPLPIPTSSGKLIDMVNISFEDEHGELYEANNIIRLQTFLPGVVYEDALTVKASVLGNIGETCAYLHDSLKSYTKEIDALRDHIPAWDLRNVPATRSWLSLIPDLKWRRFAEDVIQKFEENVLRHLDKLTIGVVHGDLNNENIILKKVESGREEEDPEYEFNGVIDFADACLSYHIFDLAICLTYFSMDSKQHHPLIAAGYVFNGYEKMRTLRDFELQLLSLCVVGRLVQSNLYAYDQRANASDERKNYEELIQGKWSLAKLWWDTPVDELFRLWGREGLASTGNTS
ncbi:hydroxylysine kinase-like isoform X2 [Lineus longissimus]